MKPTNERHVQQTRKPKLKIVHPPKEQTIAWADRYLKARGIATYSEILAELENLRGKQ